jgi:uncharacterized membrane protein YbhN (UPF0104 family)
MNDQSNMPPSKPASSDDHALETRESSITSLFDDDTMIAERDPAPPKRRWTWLGTAASLVLLAISVYVLWRISSEIDSADVMRAFSRASGEQLLFAIGLCAFSYLLLTCYDALALRQLHLKVSYATTALASFTSYAVSFNLGFPLITGGTVRYWIYAPKGLSAAQVASLAVIAGITFWLGMGVVLGWSLIKEAITVADLTNLKVSVTRLLGVTSLGLVIAYFIWVGLKRRVVSLQGWRLELPGFRLSGAQAILGIGDVCASAGVLYVLLPAGHGIGFETFLALYVAAVMLGIASHSPGGLGVFEATILLSLDHLPKGQVLGSLLLFRLIYFIAPFILALALLGGYEIRHRLKTLATIFKRGGVSSPSDM